MIMITFFFSEVNDIFFVLKKGEIIFVKKEGNKKRWFLFKQTKTVQEKKKRY